MPPTLPLDQRLAPNPLDHIVQIGLLALSEEFKFALRAARSADIRVHVGVAAVHVPLDRSGFPPQKHRLGRESVIVIAIGRGGKKRGEWPGAIGPVDSRRHVNSVANANQYVLLFDHRSRS